jgi:hypothetical protein
MKAELLFHQRIDYYDGAIVEMVLWRVPTPVPPSMHGLKDSHFMVGPAFARLGTTMNGVKAIIGIFRALKRIIDSLP